MTVHKLKTWPKFLEDIAENRKPFELRKDDRDYKVGDTLMLEGWDPDTESYNGDWLAREVTYVLRDAPHFGLMPGFCILGIA